jgi:type IV pilus assembly protein PilF
MARRAEIALLLLALLTGCVSVNPTDSSTPKADPHEASRLNTQLGLGYLNEGNMAVAQDRLSRAVEEDPDNADAHAALAMFYTRRGNLDEAEKSYRHALSIDPRRPEILNAVGSFLCGHDKGDEGLKDLLAAAETLSYNTPEIAWTNAATCARSIQRPAEVEQYLRSALQANPNYPDALLRMAEVNYDKQDYRGAHAFLQRYERVGPPAPDELLLGARVARQLGDAQDAHDYEVKLIQKFPNSDQAREVQKRVTP